MLYQSKDRKNLIAFLKKSFARLSQFFKSTTHRLFWGQNLFNKNQQAPVVA
jgi:hypothetical protein